MAASNAAAGPPSEAAGSSSRLYPTTRPNNSNYTSVPISFEPSSGSSADSATNLNLNNRNLGWTGQRPSILTQQSYNLQPERPGDQSRRSTLPHPPSSSRTNSDPYPLMVVEHPTFMGLAQPAPRMKHQGVYHYVYVWLSTSLKEDVKGRRALDTGWSIYSHQP
ncbi:hypothetical protein I316_05883 [Kwoniella heveanensis BCC8398]|uniref:Uncharacterized protein n=1 Tax=Kwoniella heveanensis BCC8398 TaxID=1296120 RepID=A0A1B9GN87_9TREE|nr:hypothetical protein I316_05883 [Kwoniella heveanensis BCC8398]